MKNKHLILIGCLLLAACSPKEDKLPDPTVFRTSPGVVQVTAVRQKSIIKVECDQPWTVKLAKGEWVTLLGKQAGTDNNGQVEVEFALNPEMEQRKDTLVFSSGSQTRKVALLQRSVESIVMQKEIRLNATEASVVRIDSPDAWRLVSDGSDWFDLSPTSGNAGNQSFTLRAKDENLNVGTRTAALRLIIGEKDEIPLTVYQLQKDVIILDGSKVKIDYRGGLVKVQTQTNVDFSVSYTSDWVETVTTKGLNEDITCFQVARYEGRLGRSVTITFKGAGLTQTFEIEQEAMDPLLRMSDIGVYDVYGSSWTYEPLSDQLLCSAQDAAYSFAILTPEYSKAVEVMTPSLAQAKEDDEVAVRLVLNRNSQIDTDMSLTMKVLRIADGKAWLRAEDGPGCIILQQVAAL